MADIFNEVDEEVRRERFLQLWNRYGNYAIVVAILVIAGIGGWRGYEYWQAQKAAEAGAAFEQAMTLADDGKHQEAEASFAKVAADGTPGYRMLARLREAAEAAQRDPKAGVSAYDALAADAGLAQSWRDLASIRAGYVLVDNASLDEMKRRLEPLAGPQGPFRHTAREMLALAAWRVGDVTTARKWSELIAADPEAPASMRTRMETLIALMPEAAKG